MNITIEYTHVWWHFNAKFHNNIMHGMHNRNNFYYTSVMQDL